MFKGLMCSLLQQLVDGPVMVPSIYMLTSAGLRNNTD